MANERPQNTVPADKGERMTFPLTILPTLCWRCYKATHEPGSEHCPSCAEWLHHEAAYGWRYEAEFDASIAEARADPDAMKVLRKHRCLLEYAADRALFHPDHPAQSLSGFDDEVLF
jgi:hypothetical protein